MNQRPLACGWMNPKYTTSTATAANATDAPNSAAARSRRSRLHTANVGAEGHKDDRLVLLDAQRERCEQRRQSQRRSSITLFNHAIAAGANAFS